MQENAFKFLFVHPPTRVLPQGWPAEIIEPPEELSDPTDPNGVGLEVPQPWAVGFLNTPAYYLVDPTTRALVDQLPAIRSALAELGSIEGGPPDLETVQDMVFTALGSATTVDTRAAYIGGETYQAQRRTLWLSYFAHVILPEHYPQRREDLVLAIRTLGFLDDGLGATTGAEGLARLQHVRPMIPSGLESALVAHAAPPAPPPDPPPPGTADPRGELVLTIERLEAMRDFVLNAETLKRAKIAVAQPEPIEPDELATQNISDTLAELAKDASLDIQRAITRVRAAFGGTAAVAPPSTASEAVSASPPWYLDEGDFAARPEFVQELETCGIDPTLTAVPTIVSRLNAQIAELRAGLHDRESVERLASVNGVWVKVRGRRPEVTK